MKFGEVLTRAWEIIWKFKALWIFGILAGCAGSGHGNLNFSLSDQDIPDQLQFRLDAFESWEIAAIIGSAIFVILLLIVLAIFFSTIGKIALVQGARRAESGAERQKFGELFRLSTPYFWRIFGLYVLVWLAITIGLPIVVILLAVTIIGIPILLVLLCLLLPFLLVVSLVLRQAMIAIICEDLDIMDGLKRGWQIIRSKPGEILVMWLILDLALGILAGIVLGLPFLAILAPLVISLLAKTQPVWTGLLVSGICLAAYLPVLLLVSGILRSFIDVAWTLTFLRLTTPYAPKAVQLEEQTPPPASLEDKTPSEPPAES